jgi:hypothetical protein
MLSRGTGTILLIATLLAVSVVAVLVPPIHQPLSYHNFADQRAWLGIPNFGDVSSNIPFALVGLGGLVILLKPGAARFNQAGERWPYLVMSVGLILTAFGSGYYHLAPDNARLVWDRIPIMIVFLAVVTAVIVERVGIRAGLALFPILEIVGIASVLTWRSGELRGQGDLRFYAAVQVSAILVLLLALLLPARYTRGSDFAVVVGFYVLAKIFETFDRQIFSFLRVISGHTLKHLAAAAAGYWIVRMLQRRQSIELLRTAPLTSVPIGAKVPDRSV